MKNIHTVVSLGFTLFAILPVIAEHDDYRADTITIVAQDNEPSSPAVEDDVETAVEAAMEHFALEASENSIDSEKVYSGLHRNIDPTRKDLLITQIAKIVGGILNIARDPRNPHNVGDSVGSMLQGIITITTDAIQHKKEKKNQF